MYVLNESGYPVMWRPMFLVALFVLAKNVNQPKYPSTKKWIYSNSKQKKRLLLHAIVQTNLTEIILSKRSQTRKSTYCMIPCI